MVISILWIPVILSSAGGQLYVYLQSIQSALGPPIFVLYLFAVLWPRTNEQVKNAKILIPPALLKGLPRPRYHMTPLSSDWSCGTIYYHSFVTYRVKLMM